MIFNIIDSDSRYSLRNIAAMMIPAAFILYSLVPPAKSSFESVGALSCNQETADSLFKQAEECKDQKQFDEAIFLFNQYLEYMPKNSTAFADKAFCQNGLHGYPDALATADKALALDAENINALSNRAWALNHMHRHGEALQSAMQALDLDPGDAESWCAEGDALLGLGDYHSAVVAFNKHCAMHPAEWYGYDRRATAYEKLGMNDLAAKDREMVDKL